MNVYEAVTDRILKKLEEGVIPWRKTWTSGLPKSLTSGKEYRGVNIFLLGMTEFTSRYWTTFLQAKRLGGHIRKGEKGTLVYYWHWRTEEEIEKLRQKTGKGNFAPCSLFTSVAFNLDQVEGIERPEDDIPAFAQTIDAAEKRTALREKPACEEMHAYNVQEFLFRHRHRRSDQISFATQHASKIRTAMNLAPQFAMLLREAQKIGGAPGLSFLTKRSGGEQQSKNDPDALEKREPVLGEPRREGDHARLVAQNVTRGQRASRNSR